MAAARRLLISLSLSLSLSLPIPKLQITVRPHSVDSAILNLVMIWPPLNSLCLLLISGVLVINVTWRGKTYVGTLLDSTQHANQWAPPR